MLIEFASSFALFAALNLLPGINSHPKKKIPCCLPLPRRMRAKHRALYSGKLPGAMRESNDDLMMTLHVK